MLGVYDQPRPRRGMYCAVLIICTQLKKNVYPLLDLGKNSG